MLDDIYEQQAQLEYQTEPKAKPKPQITPPITQEEIETTIKQIEDNRFEIIFTAVATFLSIWSIGKLQAAISERNRLRREEAKRYFELMERAEEEEEISEDKKDDIDPPAPESEYLQRKRMERERYEEAGRKASKLYIPLDKELYLPLEAAVLPPTELIILMQLRYLLKAVRLHLPNMVNAYENRLLMLLNWLNPIAIPVARQIINGTATQYQTMPAEYPNANMLLRHNGTTAADPNIYPQENRDEVNTTFIEGIALPPHEVRTDYHIDSPELIAQRRDLRETYIRYRIRDLEDQIVDTERRLMNLDTLDYGDDIMLQQETEDDRILLREDLQQLQDEIASLTQESEDSDDMLPGPPPPPK
jgi:hypothetical protein